MRMISRMLRSKTVATLLLVGLAAGTHSQTKDWQAVIDPFWNTASNWTPASVPLLSEDVTIQPAAPSTSEVAFVIASGVAKSIDLEDSLLGIEGELIVDESLNAASSNASSPSEIILYFNDSKLQVGANSTVLPALSLIGGSKLELRRGASAPLIIDPPSMFTSYGLVNIDELSTIRGAGVVDLRGDTSGLDLNGTLEAATFGAVDDLLSVSTTGSSRLDLDGSLETGRIIVGEGATLLLDGNLTDSFSGVLSMMEGSEVDFINAPIVSIDGYLKVFGPTATIPVTVNINADTLSFAESAIIDLEGTVLGEVVINANSLLVSGDIKLWSNKLIVNSAVPWRLEGEVKNIGGIANIEGAPFTIGAGTSPSSKALLNAFESIDISADLTLESSAEVRVVEGAALGNLTLRGATIFQGPNINQFVGPWPGVDLEGTRFRPSSFYFYGDIIVERSTTVFSSSAFIGDSGTPMDIDVNANQTFVLDGRRFLTQPTVSVVVNDNATLEMILSDPTITSWTNEMSISLVNGTLRSSNIVNNGSITGTGLVDASVSGAGFISPGLSSGRLEFGGDVNLAGTEIYMEIGGSTLPDYDQIVVNGDFVVNNGKLVVEFIDGYVPSRGESFELFSGGGTTSLDFSDIQVVGLPDNAQIQTRNLSTEGVVSFTRNTKLCQKKHRKYRKYLKCKIRKKLFKYPNFFNFWYLRGY